MKSASREESRRINFKSLVLPIAIVVMCAIFQIMNPNFMTLRNWTNIGRQQAALLIGAVGQTFVVLTGGTDLSQGSMIGIVSVVSADIAIKYGFPAAVLVSIALGCLVGIIQGYLVAKVRIPSFIVSLGFLNILRGSAYIYSNGMPISGLPAVFSNIGSSSVLGLPLPFVIALIILIIAYLVLEHLTVGREVYSIGGNEEAARLAGINVVRARVFAYMACGVLTAIAGVVQTARISVGQCTLGDGFQLQTIAAVVIGGTSMRGGEGNALKTLLGVLLLAIIANGLNLLRVSSYMQTVVNGIIIIIAVGVDVIGQKTKR